MSTFLNSALTLAEQVGILFVLIAVGFALTKANLLEKKSTMGLANLILYITTPTIVIKSFLTTEFNKQTIIKLGIAIGCAVVSHVIGILLSFIIREKDKDTEVVWRFGTIFSNAGYMAIPLTQAVLGEEGVFYASGYVIVFNVIQWTYGISIYNKESTSKLKVLINPGTIAVAIGLPLFFLGVNFDVLPSVISTPINHIANLNAPLAMFVAGYYVAISPLSKGLSNLRLWLSIFLRNFAVPLIALVLFKYVFGLEGILLSSCVLSASAPVAFNTIVLASKFDRDADSSLRLVAFSTLFSIISMPIVLAVVPL